MLEITDAKTAATHNFSLKLLEAITRKSITVVFADFGFKSKFEQPCTLEQGRYSHKALPKIVS